jgi:hypothetical protein
MKTLREIFIDFLLSTKRNITKRIDKTHETSVVKYLKPINTDNSAKIKPLVINSQTKVICNNNFHNYEIDSFGHCTVCYSKYKITKLIVHNTLHHC